MSFAFRVFLEGIVDGHWPIAEVLSVHAFDGSIGGFKIYVVNESIAFGLSAFRIFGHACIHHRSERTEGVVELLFVHQWIEVADEQVGADVHVCFLLCRFVHSYGFSIQLDHVHDLHGIICVFFRFKLHESIPLVLSCHPILRQIHVGCTSSHAHELPSASRPFVSRLRRSSHAPTGPACTMSSHTSSSVTWTSNPPKYAVWLAFRSAPPRPLIFHVRVDASPIPSCPAGCGCVRSCAVVYGQRSPGWFPWDAR
mmetsp:Transcript_7694/g.47568  ORF Transcript_7694/g.47568 Transcript_7694/m.47568 type:complete len:254 (-) Transcript_7694:7-768(-)